MLKSLENVDLERAKCGLTQLGVLAAYLHGYSVEEIVENYGIARVSEILGM